MSLNLGSFKTYGGHRFKRMYGYDQILQRRPFYKKNISEIALFICHVTSERGSLFFIFLQDKGM